MPIMFIHHAYIIVFMRLASCVTMCVCAYTVYVRRHTDIYINISIYKSRGVAYTGYDITSGGEDGDEGEKRESYLFHHTTRFHCAPVAATLRQGPTGCFVYMFPSILVRSVWTKIGSILGQPKRAGKISFVDLLSCKKEIHSVSIISIFEFSI